MGDGTHWATLADRIDWLDWKDCAGIGADAGVHCTRGGATPALHRKAGNEAGHLERHAFPKRK
ncbi:hypothetical protein OE88DRAFT_1667411 [Heliocybe sulcata]|uniref:Uncharacterized protein n=1 Tax=Heliocybe sulcata TaxID=5364 RepID=A0A5C3MQT2_9AGAM|nr:hypothetical protein OE88DRAFT_1667411 [Heliocybe sulcata]